MKKFEKFGKIGGHFIELYIEGVKDFSLIKKERRIVMDYITAVTNLQTVLLSIASAIGGVLLIYGGIRFAIAFQKLDQQGEHQAIFTIVAGGILLGLSALVALLQ